MSRIDLNVVATGNFGQLESQLARLKAQVAGLNASMSSGMMINPAAISGMQNYANLMADNLRSTGMFQAKMVSLTSETERFGQSLQRGNLRLGDYFRTATGHIRNQQTEIQRLAREQVRLMNSTSLAMGDGRAMVITPTGIDEAIHKQQILNQEYRIFRQVVAGGSTQLINWGKNTQWAGRQLTVGLTVPLTLFGAAAAKTFMEADKQLTRLTKVYGDAARGVVSPGELQSIRDQTLGLAKDIAANMGVAAEETLGIAADIAATGKEGNELLAATNEAMRLSVLGEVDRQEAMRATLSIQSVFKKDTEGLAESINFLNAVENETSASINDLVTGIVKAGPVVQGLGGDIEDLALMMVAMREGGIPASEAANAIKSSLASLINPTKQTTQVLNSFGVNLVSIVDKNAGDVIGTLIDLQGALSGLDELSRQRAIEQIFGKFQFSRINALLNNLGKAGSQTEEVLKLAGLSVEDLAANADAELKAVTDSVSGRFQRALESIKANLIPVGEVFTKVGTMLLEVGNKILEIFNNLPGPVKNFVQGLMFLTGLAGPIIMITGVFGNFLGYLLKGVSSLMAIKQAGRGVFEYFTPESIAARNASELITEAFYDETTAVGKLNTALEQLNKTLVEMQQNSTAAVGSMQGLAAGTMAAAEAGTIESSYYRRTGSGDAAGMAGGVFSHRSSKKAMTEVEAGLVAGTGSLLPADFVRATTINTIIKEDVVPIIAEGANQASIELVEGLRNKLNAGLRGGLRPDEERRVFQTKEAYLGETTGQVAFPAVMAKAAAQGVLPDDIIAAQTAFADDIVKSGIETAMSNLKTSMTKMGVDLGLEVDKIHTDLAEIFEKSMRDTGGDVVASMEEVRKAAQKMEEKAKQALAEANVPMRFATGTDVKSGEGMSKKVSTASQLAMGEYYGLAGMEKMSPELKNATDRRIRATNALAAAEEKLRIQEEQLSRLSKEEVLKERRKLKDLDMEHAFAKTTANGSKTIYAKSQGQWVQILSNGEKKIITESKLIAELEKRAVAESRVARLSKYVEEADKMEAEASKKAAQADLLEAESSGRAARADMGEAAGGAAPGVPGATGKGRFRRFMGSGAGAGALGALSMATMLVPTGPEDSGVSQGVNAAANIAGMAGMGAAMGSVLPGAGTAIGGGIGLAIGAATEGMNFFARKSEEAAAALQNIKLKSDAMSGSFSELEKTLLGIEGFSGFEDMPLDAFNLKTEEARNRLQEFSDALKQAEEGTLEKARIDTFAATGSAEQLTSNNVFRGMILGAVQGGASEEAIKTMVGGYLSAAGKEDFSEYINTEIERIFSLGDNAQEIAAKYVAGLSRKADDIINEVSKENPQFRGLINAQAAYDQFRGGKGITVGGVDQSLFDLIRTGQENNLSSFLGQPGAQDLLSRYQAGEITADQALAPTETGMESPLAGALSATGISSLEIGGVKATNDEMLTLLELVSRLNTEIPNISDLGDEFAAVQESAKVFAESMENALSSSSPEEFGTYIDSLKSSVDGLNSSSPEIVELVNNLNNSGDAGKAAATAFNQMMQSGVSTSNALKVLKMASEGSNYSIQQLAEMAKDPINFEIIYNQFVRGQAPQGMTGYSPTAGGTMPSSAISEAISVAESGGGGGGGSSDTSAIEEIYDKQIEKQDKLIEKIKEERAERQKLYDLEKQAFDFAMKEQDLKNQIARARAEGRTAEAAMLQAQLDNSREVNKEQEAERRRQELEDRRIEKAERTKEKLQSAKERATDQGGGGGGGGTVKIDAQRIDILTQGLVKWTEGAKFQSDVQGQGPWSAFFQSKQVSEYREQLEKLGIPAEQIDNILNELYDSFIMNNKIMTESTGFKATEKALGRIGLTAEGMQDVLPNVFGVLQDKTLTSTEKMSLIEQALVDIGFTSEEAARKAQSVLDTIQNDDGNSKAILDELTQGFINIGEDSDVAKTKAEEVFSLITDESLTRDQKIDLVAKAFEDAGMQADLARESAQKYADSLGISDSVISRINSIGGAWKQTARNAEEAALLQALAQDVVTLNLSADAAQGRIDSIRNRFNTGGYILGPGTSTSDSIPVRLSNGEYVIRASTVDKFGVPFFDALNKGVIPMMAQGGMVSRYPSIAAGMARGGYVRTGYNMGGLVSGKESEYNINVYVTESNASADDIANKVMQSLQRRDKMNRAGIRI